MFNAEATASDRAQFEEEATQYVSDFKLTPSGEKYANPLTFAMFMGWRLGKKTSGAAPSSAPPDSADYWRQVAAKLGVELHKLKSLAPSSAGPQDETRFAEFDDADHPANKWWQEHGQFMMAGGGRREFIWACRGWIAREQLACGVEVTGESTRERPSSAGTDTQHGVSSEELGRKFPAFFQPAPPEAEGSAGTESRATVDEPWGKGVQFPAKIQVRAAASEGTPPACPDCDEAAKQAYSDATTPGFFSPKCAKHRETL